MYKVFVNDVAADYSANSHLASKWSPADNLHSSFKEAVDYAYSYAIPGYMHPVSFQFALNKPIKVGTDIFGMPTVIQIKEYVPTSQELIDWEKLHKEEPIDNSASFNVSFNIEVYCDEEGMLASPLVLHDTVVTTIGYYLLSNGVKVWLIPKVEEEKQEPKEEEKQEPKEEEPKEEQRAFITDTRGDPKVHNTRVRGAKGVLDKLLVSHNKIRDNCDPSFSDLVCKSIKSAASVLVLADSAFFDAAALLFIEDEDDEDKL